MTSAAQLPDRTIPARPAQLPDRPASDPRRWIALIFIALAQLMIALDATIMNVALPSVQAALGFSDADRQWVITAYTLAFGGLLLLGGRIADRIGRARAFLIGLIGFAAASAAGGLAINLATLAAARAAQGAFGALLAPTVLSLLAVTFTEPRERGKAFAIFGAIAGGGGAAGLVLGGVLADSFTWRACLLVTVPIAIVAAAGGWYARGGPRASHGGRLDVPGALLATAGLVALVFACTQVGAKGWTSIPVVALLGAGTALLAGFALWEARAVDPLLPPRILADRNRAGAYLSVGFAVAGMLGLFLFLTYYFQVVLGYSPVTAGLAFLPLSAAVMLSSQVIAGRLLPHLAPRLMIVPGLLVAATAMVLLTRLDAADRFVSVVLPSEVLLGLGMGCVFTPAISTATARVAPREAGVAAAVVNTAQQVGGSLGVALLNTVATAGGLSTRSLSPAALVHGYANAAAWAAGILVAAAALAAVLINAGPPGAPSAAQEGDRR